MNNEYRSPVPAPTSQPLCFDLPPETKPPTIRATKVNTMISQEKDASVKDVNRKSSEKIKLTERIITNVVISP